LQPYPKCQADPGNWRYG